MNTLINQQQTGGNTNDINNYHSVLMKAVQSGGLYIGIFKEESVQAFLLRLERWGFGCLNQIYNYVGDKFLVDALDTIKGWNSNVQQEEMVKIQDAKEIYKATVVIYIKEIYMKTKPGDDIKFSIPEFSEFTYYFIKQLAQDNFVRSGAYFKGDKLIERRVIHMDALRNTLEDLVRKTIVFVPKGIPAFNNSNNNNHQMKVDINGFIPKVVDNNHQTKSTHSLQKKPLSFDYDRELDFDDSASNQSPSFKLKSAGDKRVKSQQVIVGGYNNTAGGGGEPQWLEPSPFAKAVAAQIGEEIPFQSDKQMEPSSTTKTIKINKPSQPTTTPRSVKQQPIATLTTGNGTIGIPSHPLFDSPSTKSVSKPIEQKPMSTQNFGSNLKQSQEIKSENNGNTTTTVEQQDNNHYSNDNRGQYQRNKELNFLIDQPIPNFKSSSTKESTKTPSSSMSHNSDVKIITINDKDNNRSLKNRSMKDKEKPEDKEEENESFKYMQEQEEQGEEEQITGEDEEEEEEETSQRNIPSVPYGMNPKLVEHAKLAGFIGKNTPLPWESEDQESESNVDHYDNGEDYNDDGNSKQSSNTINHKYSIPNYQSYNSSNNGNNSDNNSFHHKKYHEI